MSRSNLLDAYRAVRGLSLELCQPLETEDFRVQSIPEVSPPWWNLGHTTWFFAKNILEPRGRYTEDDARLEVVLNSYYEALGPRIARDRRGLVTRPTTEEIFSFRRSVDERMEALLREASGEDLEGLDEIVTTGIHHEQQHQELLLTEVKHILSSNAPELRSSYASQAPGSPQGESSPLEWISIEGGLVEIGNLEGGWCFDHELPVHKVYLQDFSLASRLVTNGEFQGFIEDGGYAEPLLWLANGWDRVRELGWRAPLYWEGGDGEWRQWTLLGELPLDPAEPVCHLSFYEADAFARWKGQTEIAFAGARLPTEGEWERAARATGFRPWEGNFLEDRRFHPLQSALGASGTVTQLAGDLWEWTSSHYEAYPGYRPFEGKLAEYNGKFMDNQRVLRGGSCATPRSHIRASYRNFWAPETRFQLTGLRMARL